MKKNIYLMYAIGLLQGMVFYGPIATLYRQAQGVTVFQITLIESISLALCIALEVPWGYLADRHPPGMIAIFSSLLTAGFMFSLTFAHSMFFLFAARFAMIFASSGLDPALQIWLCRKTIPQTRGLIFGWAASARSFGWFVAPLIGGIVTKFLGIRYLFVVGPVFFIVILFLIIRVMKRFSDFREEDD